MKIKLIHNPLLDTKTNRIFPYHEQCCVGFMVGEMNIFVEKSSSLRECRMMKLHEKIPTRMIGKYFAEWFGLTIDVLIETKCFIATQSIESINKLTRPHDVMYTTWYLNVLFRSTTIGVCQILIRCSFKNRIIIDVVQY
eukprot:443897_1